LQVEHPVTEETAKVDLVVEQIRVAQGHELSIKETPKAQGHAIEFRINAEDPARGFIPAFGVLSLFEAPFGQGVRVTQVFVLVHWCLVTLTHSWQN
jgi:acetyl-CoA/propionyl-CoA carboxylase biotin carboxyl carrier protein